MFTVVYVVVDSEKLFFYNEMMKSLTSLRMHMPEQKVCVLTDEMTYTLLKNQNAEVFDLSEVISVNMGDNYTQVEKSRYIKTSIREILSGDLLYIDTDTVICDSFPETVSDKSIGMVLEFHSLRSESNWYLTDKYDKDSGLELEKFDYFYNGGVVWSKDDDNAHRFYRKWHNLWEQTRLSGCPRDQSPLNYVVREEFDIIDTLDGVWNCQLARAFSMGLNYLSEAHIIHYFNVNTSAYKLGQEEYRKLPYNDDRIVEMLHHPQSLFSKCRLIKLTDNNKNDGCNMAEICPEVDTYQYKFLAWCYRHKTIHRINEFFFRCIFAINDRVKKMFRR